MAVVEIGVRHQQLAVAASSSDDGLGEGSSTSAKIVSAPQALGGRSIDLLQRRWRRKASSTMAPPRSSDDHRDLGGALGSVADQVDGLQGLVRRSRVGHHHDRAPDVHHRRFASLRRLLGSSARTLREPRSAGQRERAAGSRRAGRRAARRRRRRRPGAPALGLAGDEATGRRAPVAAQWVSIASRSASMDARRASPTCIRRSEVAARTGRRRAHGATGRACRPRCAPARAPRSLDRPGRSSLLLPDSIAKRIGPGTGAGQRRRGRRRRGDR